MNSKEYCYEYPRPAVTTDCVIISLTSETPDVLLIQRGSEPFKGKWALPGGFMQMDETAEEGAGRELFEETGIKVAHLEQLHTFTGIDRDPRARTISIAFFALVNTKEYRITAADDASEVDWFSLKKLPPLAFDHQLILTTAIKKLAERIPEQFSDLLS